MHFSSFLLLLLSASVFSRPAQVSFDSEPIDDSSNLYKRADASQQQDLVMARLQQLLGPEAFVEFDTHGRLSNLQRLG